MDGTAEQLAVTSENEAGESTGAGVAQAGELPVQPNGEVASTSTPNLMKRHEVARILAIPLSQAKRATDAVLGERPELFRLGTTAEDAQTLYCENEVLHLVSATLPAPEDWLSSEEIARQTGTEKAAVESLLKRLRKDEPIFIRPHLIEEEDQVETHVAPGVVGHVTEILHGRAERQRSRARLGDLEEDFKGFVEEVRQGLTLEASEMQKLIGLFGSEYAADLFFHYRRDYQRIPVEVVKSYLADYLGDVLVNRGGFNVDLLEMSSEFLSDASLRDALTEVIKRDCLTSYQHTRRSNPSEDELDIIFEYLDRLSLSIADLDNPDLRSVIKEVEDYYLSLFEDYKAPDSFVEGLQAGRPFPDLNQRINAKEICEKGRMLIADDPGLGKSASAIMAKELLQAELAVIVAPKSVIDKRMWQNYLSDLVNEEGEQVGYFKPGQAPRVLVVRGPESLADVSAEDYDYIIISHERLDPAYGYVDELLGIGFDMLIVDEAHKLKNMSDGVRASQLTELSNYLADRKNTSTVMLTATPAPNKVSDIAMVLRLLYPKKFAEYKNKELAYLIINGDVRDLRSLLLPRMQMKSLEDCIDLPKMREVTEYVELSDRERELYELLLEEDEIDFSSKLHSTRKALLNPAALEVVPPLAPAKALAINQRLNQTFATKRKVLLFVNDYVDRIIRGEIGVDETIFDFLQLPEDVVIRRIYGDTSEEQRYQVQQEFQRTDSRILLAVNGQVNDVGVDFSAADEQFFYNEGWTMSEKRQEIGRSHRPGRTTPLVVRTFIAADTVEVGISDYIRRKDLAIRKLLFGIPLSELEKERLRAAEEDKAEANIEVNPELASHFFSSVQRLNRMIGRTQQQGERRTREMLKLHGAEYAATYRDLTTRSYQANMARLTGSLIDTFLGNNQQSRPPRILDLGSGPEMLKRHISDKHGGEVISLDINQEHFLGNGTAAPKNIVGSVVKVPVASDSIDVISLGLVLDTTKFLRSKQGSEDDALERLAIFKEINRLLHRGGRAVITLKYSLDFADYDALQTVLERMGFQLIEDYTGLVYSDKELRGSVITLEKQRDCAQDIDQLVSDIGQKHLAGLSFAERDIKVKAPKKIDRAFQIENSQRRTLVEPTLNAVDQRVADEEDKILEGMIAQKRQYHKIRHIPPEEIVAKGLSRIRNGKRYVLFKRLLTAAGAVYIKD